MTSLCDIPKKIDEARALLLKIQDGHMGADVEHERVRNYIALSDLELKIHQINSMDTLSRKMEDVIIVLGSSAQSQGKQTGSMIRWTRIMAIAIIIQSLVLGTQVLLALHIIRGQVFP